MRNWVRSFVYCWATLMRPRRTDANHRQIVEALRSRGLAVLDLHAIPGVLDLLVGYRSVLYLVEIKNGSKPPSRRRVTPAEQTTIALFKGQGCPVVVVGSIEELLRAIGASAEATDRRAAIEGR